MLRVLVATVLDEMKDVKLFSLYPRGFVIGEEGGGTVKQVNGCLEDSLDLFSAPEKDNKEVV